MLKPKPVFIAIAAAGVAAGVLRGIMLSTVFDKTTGVAEPNHPLTWTLIGLAVLTAVAALFTRLDVAAPVRGKGIVTPWVLLACVALGVSAIVDFADMTGGGATFTQFILAALGLLSAALVMLLVTSKNAQKLTLGLFATVPIFWSCFWFLLLFARNSSNPVILGYIFEFLAVLFTVGSCYALAGFYFGLVKTQMLGLFVSLGIFFSLTSMISPIAAWIIAPETSMLEGVTPAGMLRMAFALMYMIAIPTMARAAVDMPENSPEDPEDKKEEGENAEDQAV